MKRSFAAVVAIAALSVQRALASVGDRSVKFHLCRQSCEIDTCWDHRPKSLSDDTIVVPDPLPWYLIMTGWSCESNCAYHCTHRITNEAKKRVSDIQTKITDGVVRERAEAKMLKERWAEQLVWDKKGDEFKELCGDTHFLSSTGDCVPLMTEPPPPLLTEAEARRKIDSMVAQELSYLSVIDKQTVQFFGKWPQLRLLGMQEPMSVLFSILNLLVQLHAIFHGFSDLIPDTFPLKSVYLWHAKIASVAWTASTVFHTRDVWWTERWDYFSAAAVLMSGLFLALCRLLYLRPGTHLFRHTLMACVGAWAVHVLYLLLHRRLDYTYNMAACLTVGFVHNTLWLLCALMPHVLERARALLVSRTRWSGSKDLYGAAPSLALSGLQRQHLEMLVAAMFLAPALELFDFPPILRLIDAHSLWHCATIPLTFFWYQWLVNDARECVRTTGWHSDRHAERVVTDVDELAGAGTSTSLPAALSMLPLAAPEAEAASVSAASSTDMSLQPLWAQAHQVWGALCEWTWHTMRILRGMIITS
ncbi:hypothetical protein MEQU1_000700 [Malassezia equina]|uniref:Post-GPI attachment to proteins factor 3 n=1 Tax=Malassezia equina TaxID=1381935 RepID=A0AAF0ECU1_9BASI|nr:hypothetical protein MEQU1_000700 [Malassezia equina]